MNGKRLERDIRSLKPQGYDAVFLDDATFTLNWKWAEKVCDLLHECGLQWACQTRVDCVDKERLSYMKKTGCVYVYYGLESGSVRVQSAIHKPLAPEKTIEAIQLTRQLGMRATASFIFGVPLVPSDSNRPTLHDTKDDWAASVELIRRAKPDNVVPTIFCYYPGSPAWAQLPAEQQSAYVKGVNRKIWSFFDDGYGGIHHVTKEEAGDIGSI